MNITKSLHELSSVVANASAQRHRVLSSHELATMLASIREVQRGAKRKRETNPANYYYLVPENMLRVRLSTSHVARKVSY